MSGAGAVAVEFSFWMPFAVLSAALVGFATTLVQCGRHGLVHGGLTSVLRSQWRTFVALTLLDCFGAALCLLGVFLVMPARPTAVELSSDLPALFWLLVGLAGPLAGAGLLGLVPQGLVFTARTSTGRDAASVPLRDLRRYFIRHLQRVLDQREKTWHVYRRRWLLAILRRSQASQSLDIENLCELVEMAAADEKSGRRLPNHWQKLRREWTNLPEHLRGSSLLPGALSSAAVSAGFIDEVAAGAGVMLTDFNFAAEYPSYPEASVAPSGPAAAPIADFDARRDASLDLKIEEL